MSELGVALRFLRGRRLASLLTVLSVALAVALVVASVILARAVRTAFVEGTTDYNLIVGAKGSATQLVMSVVFRLDTPLPNIRMSTYEGLREDRRIEVAVPVALGDAYQGFRYVATTAAYAAPAPWRRTSLGVASGRWFSEDRAGPPGYEAVLGAEAAHRTGLRIGDRFYEGEEMAAHPFTVVGVLRAARGADDRAIFVSLASYWDMNEIARAMSDKPLSAVLLRPRRMSDLPGLHRQLNLADDTQAAFPSVVLLSLFNILDVAEDVMALILALVAIVAVLGLAVSMYRATWERRREIATLRALGAGRRAILRIVLLECGLLATAGAIAGVAGGAALAWTGARVLAGRLGVVVDPLALGWPPLAVLMSTMLVGTCAGLLPALTAHRLEVAENLAPVS